MDHTAFSALDEDALELRVLEGPQAGARAPLAGTCVLAVADAATEDDEADLLLHDDSGPGARVRIAAAGGHALLEVLAGTVELGGETLETGRVAPWPPRTPLRLGATLVSFGPAGRADDDVAASTDPATAAQVAAEAQAAIAHAELPAVVRRRRPGAAWLLPLGLLATLGGLAVLTLALVHGAGGGTAQAAVKPPSLAEALQRSEFASLAVAWDSAGRPELRGRLATLAERARLEVWLAQQPAASKQPVQVQVQVDEGLARDVTDTFRLNGVAVQARVQGPGEVAVEASEPDAPHLARAEEVVRRDVRGLARLSVVNRAKPVPPPAPPVPDDPGKRIASVVPGDPAYLVTADGARYFVGAMLPTGHRITRIDGQRVTLERSGEESTLNF
jgi:type III secretion protein D